MSNKSNETISVSELKASIKKRLDELSDKLNNRDRMRVAVNLDISLASVNRYLDKDRIEETRNLELAERILNEGNAVLATNSEALSMQ